jgi:hypothetical protein
MLHSWEENDFFDVDPPDRTMIDPAIEEESMRESKKQTTVMFSRNQSDHFLATNSNWQRMIVGINSWNPSHTIDRQRKSFAEGRALICPFNTVKK